MISQAKYTHSSKSKKAKNNFTHLLVQTSLQIRAGCSEKKFDQMIKRISLSTWDICNCELKHIDKESLNLFFSNHLFVMCNSDPTISIDNFILDIKEKHFSLVSRLHQKILLYIDKTNNLLIFLVIDFGEVSTGKVNLKKSYGFDLSKVSTKLIKSHSTMILDVIKDFCKLYIKSIG